MAHRGHQAPPTQGHRPPTKDEVIAAAAQAAAQQEGQPFQALEEILFVPANVNLIADTDSGRLRFTQFIGPVGPNTFMRAYTGDVAPDVGIKIGEFFIEQGNRLKSGLIVPPAASGVVVP